MPAYFGQRPARNGFQFGGLWSPNQAALLRLRNLWNPDKDPYRANVVLDICPSANDTSIVDRTGKTVTVNGNTTLTGVSPWPGGASVALPGSSGNYLSLASSAITLGSGNFVVEALVACSVLTGSDRAIFGNRGASTRDTVVDFAIGSSGQLQMLTENTTILNVAGSAFVGPFMYLTWVRSGTTFYGFVDGKQKGTATGSYTFSATDAFRIGSDPRNGDYLNGNLVALRVSTGTDRGYTGSTIPLLTGPWANY